MIDKKVFKYWIVIFVFVISTFVILSLLGMDDEWINENEVYNLPGLTASQWQTIFMFFAILAPYLAIPLGYALATIIVRIYCRLTKMSKRITFVGYARIERPKGYLRRRYILQTIFGALVCINIWITLVSSESIMSLLLSDTGKDLMIDEDTGQMFNFPMVLWYWCPVFIMALLFAMSAVIQDTGLVSIKKLRGQSEFVDTERVGDIIFGLVKGYAGISVIINFFLLLTTPLGKEGSLVVYPFLAIVLTFHIIIAIDMFRNTGVKWIQKAVEKYYSPQLIEMSFKQSDIDPNDLIIR